MFLTIGEFLLLACYFWGALVVSGLALRLRSLQFEARTEAGKSS